MYTYTFIVLNSFMTEAVFILKPETWFLYDNGLRHERVKLNLARLEKL